MARWLLRVGIDHSGQLVLNRLWDVAIRGAVLTDLRLSGQIRDAGDHLEVQTEPTEFGYENLARQQLLADPEVTELNWVRTGQLRAGHVAARLVEAGEWSKRWSVLATGMRVFRAARPQQYIPLRTRLAHTYDGELKPRSDAEAAVALLGHALNVVRPRGLEFVRDSVQRPLAVEDCGAISEIVSATLIEIAVRESTAGVNTNPTW